MVLTRGITAYYRILILTNQFNCMRILHVRIFYIIRSYDNNKVLAVLTTNKIFP